ncbi:MAG: hypothetical protein AABZ12_02435, partial [Planctomycetota bacterium]
MGRGISPGPSARASLRRVVVMGAIAIAAACAVVCGVPIRDGAELHEDAVGDAVMRPTDPGADGPFDPHAHHLADLQSITIGSWSPLNARLDLFTGSFSESGLFLRMDLEVAGLLNPPGNEDPWDFRPFSFGPHPIYAFVELDVDTDMDTGGETYAPQYRYLGNIARFGGLPDDRELAERCAVDATAFDGDFLSAPLVERSGEEFHLALLGSQVQLSSIQKLVGDGDGVFGAGETWRLNGPFLHRAHGFEPFSLAFGGAVPGEYSPNCDLQFQHDAGRSVTTISLVFPLVNSAAATMRNQPEQPDDADPSNQASVEEALADLHESAEFAILYPSGQPEELLILGWADKEPDEFLRPKDWSLTAIVGTSAEQPDPTEVVAFIWTDAYPGVETGDVNGDGSF